MPLGKDETLPQSQVEVLADSWANGEICALVKKVLGECSFAFNYLRRSCPEEAEVLVKLELNS